MIQRFASRRRTYISWLVATSVALTIHLAGSASQADETADRTRVVDVDFSKHAGTIRPLHGVNGGPMNQGETVDLRKEWKALGVPITRLHDCEWPTGSLVDMHVLFPRADADPARAENYRFAATDEFLKPIVAGGTQIVYRLGESIEHTKRKHYVHPPREPAAWAAACLGVIRHYNEGWADGQHWGIRYWEIWNEPENRPQMWTGTDEEFIRLYITAAKAIKKQWPDLKVGGPAAGATGEMVGERFEPILFLKRFIAACQREQAPLDFFSWHTYTDDPSAYAQKARGIRRWLDEAGFSKTEIHVNEWNYLPDGKWGPMLGAGQGAERRAWYEQMGGPTGAAFVACALAEMQDAPIDVANFYSGESSPFGLFERHGEPKKTYYAMQAFAGMLQTPHRVSVGGARAGELGLLAGVNESGSEASILISNYRGTADTIDLRLANLPWLAKNPRIKTAVQVLRIDADENLQEAGAWTAGGSASFKCAVGTPSVVVVKLRAEE
jgi:hypothetical protein